MYFYLDTPRRTKLYNITYIYDYHLIENDRYRGENKHKKNDTIAR